MVHLCEIDPGVCCNSALLVAYALANEICWPSCEKDQLMQPIIGCPSCIDKIFIMHLFDEIHWPTIEERTSLSNKLQDVQGCIGFINRRLIEI